MVPHALPTFDRLCELGAGTLRAMFERWYPGLANDNAANTDRAAAA